MKAVKLVHLMAPCTTHLITHSRSGPIYFKNPRKCGFFGVSCEVVPHQINYLINEVGAVGKGANETISYVHNFFARHELGEKHVHLHADNCSGQNRNNYFLWYFAWRIATTSSVCQLLIPRGRTH